MKDLRPPKQDPVKIGRTIPQGDNFVTYVYFEHEHNGRKYYSRYKHTDSLTWQRFSSKSYATDLDAKRWESNKGKFLKTLL